MDPDSTLLLKLYSHFLVMKTFHFQTKLGFRHTKVDEYLSKYLSNMDKLMEVLQGSNSTVTLDEIHIRAPTRDDGNIHREIETMLEELNSQRGITSSIDAILDEMQGDLQQLAYLFRFR